MRPTRHHASILGAMLAFSLMAYFTRRAGVPVLAMAAWRAVLVALIFAGWTVAESPARLGALKPDRTTLKLGVLYGLCLALASSTFVGGYAFTTVANAIFLHNLAPVAAFPLAWWFFRERPAPSALTGAGVAILGVGLLSGVSLFNLGHYSHPRFLLGDALALASALGYGAVLVATRATRRAGTPILATLALAWTVAALVLVLLALIGGSLALPAAGLPWVLGLAVVSTALPFWLLNLGMREVGAGHAAVLSMAEVVFATLLGRLLFGEVLSPLGALGGLLVVAGVLYCLLARAEADTSPGEAVPEPLADRTRALRLGRLALWLALLNAGALLALARGEHAGAMLAWAGGAGILRCAQPLLPGLLGTWSGRIGRWGTAGAAAALIAAVLLRGGWGAGEGSPLALLLAAAAVAIDVALAAREPEAERDRPLALWGALVLVAAGQAFALGGHGSARLLLPLGSLAVVLAGWGLLLDAFGGRLPGNPGARGSVGRMDASVGALLPWPRLAALLSVAWLLGGIRAVPPGSLGIVERLGAPLPYLVQPGLSLRLPPPIERLVVVDVASVRRVRLVASDTPLLCGDHALVAVEAVLHYRVADPLAFAFHTSDPEGTLAQVGRASLVRDIGHQSQDNVLAAGRAELEARVRAATQDVAAQLALGVAVLDVHLSAVQVPSAVAASYLDVISADEEKRTLVNEAEAYAARVMPEAFGKAVALGYDAEGAALRALAAEEGEILAMEAWRTGALIDPASTRYRLYAEAVERALSARPLAIVPAGRRVWLTEGGDAIASAAGATVPAAP